MPNTYEIVLTDDEVVGLTTHGEGPWPSPTPTVTATDQELVLTAAMRGLRSLFVRGFIDDSNSLAAELDVARKLVGRDTFTLVFPADEKLNRASWSFSTSHFRDSDGWIIEKVDGIGIHRIATATNEDRTSGLSCVMRLFYQEELPSTVDDMSNSTVTQLLILEIDSGEPVHATTVSRGLVRTGAVHFVGDGIEPVSTLEPIEFETAIENLRTS